MACSWRINVTHGGGDSKLGPIHTSAEIVWDNGWYEFFDDVEFDCQIHPTANVALSMVTMHPTSGWDVERFRWDDYEIYPPE
jgi:hypothetical protein